MAYSIEFTVGAKSIATYFLDKYAFFTRGTIKEYLNFGMTLIKESAPVGLTVLDYEIKPEYIFRLTCYNLEDTIIVVISDVTFSLTSLRCMINELLSLKIDDVTEKTLNTFIASHQDPKTFDNIARIKDQLSDVHTIMLKNIDDVLKRGEKIEDLVDKSKQLSINAKTFEKQAKKMNSCCVVQ